MRYCEQAPAKLNLSLAVEPRIVAGKHPLTSIFVTIDLCDTLIFDFEEGVRLAPDALDFELNVSAQLGRCAAEIEHELGASHEDNLVLKAVRLFLETFGAEVIPARQLAITLEKGIPLQAGLGGGSSDAAAALRVLARVAGLEPTAPALLEVARELGADVAFFLHGGCALMTGFGDELVEHLPVPHLDLRF